jgi:chromosome segregation ATPase
MARKANIAREEIHQACWELIEKNNFPNIPRLTEYFLQKDGRRCSNTTFLNAITDWEEAYKEQQQHELSELNDVLLPVFKRFSREVTQNLGKLLDEKSSEIEQHQILKQEATQSGYLSLSSALIELQAAHDSLTSEHKKVSDEAETFKQKLAFSEQRYQEVIAQNAVLTNQIKQEQKEITELRINLSQKEVDLAKQDNQLTKLVEENAKLTATLDEAQHNKTKEDAKKWQEMTKKLDALTSSVKTMQRKDRGTKQ